MATAAAATTTSGKRFRESTLPARDGVSAPLQELFERRKTMKGNRVLGRLGARELTTPEIESVGGGITVHTLVCTAMETTAARPGDGDGCNGDMDLGI
jgi:hypothetical protein